MRGRWRTGTSRSVWPRRSGARSRYFKEEEYAFSWSSGPARGHAAGFGSLRPGTGGTIQGVVKDAQGGVLPGVTVEARNVRGRRLTAVTDGRGVSVPGLSARGLRDYGHVQGFSRRNLRASRTRQTLTVDMAMDVAGVSNVQVTGESPLIDVKQNASFASIQDRTIDRIPKGRDFTSVVATGARHQQ